MDEKDEKKEIILKNKKFILISILILVILIASSALVLFIKKTPSREAKKYFELLTNKQYELSQNYLNSEINYFTVSVLNEENLNTHLGKFQFKVKNQEVVDNNAVITIWIKRPNLSDSVKEYLSTMIKSTFSGKSNDEIENEKNLLFKEKFENNEILMEELEVKINMIKLNGKWKIKNDQNLINTIFYGKTAETSTTILSNQEKQEKEEDIYISENYIELKNYKVGTSTSWSDEDVPSLSNVEFKNNGNKDIESITVTVYFKDDSGNKIAEKNVTVIGSYDEPLKAGYSWKMEDDRFYELENLTSEINLNNNEVKITKISFKKNSGFVDTEKQDYITNYLELKNYKVGTSSSWLDGDVPSLSNIEFKNNGDKDIKSIVVTVYFKDENGKNIAEKNITVIGSYDEPLKAGYSWKMEDDRFYELENLTSEINLNNNEVKITKIEFK